MQRKYAEEVYNYVEVGGFTDYEVNLDKTKLRSTSLTCSEQFGKKIYSKFATV